MRFKPRLISSHDFIEKQKREIYARAQSILVNIFRRNEAAMLKMMQDHVDQKILEKISSTRKD